MNLANFLKIDRFFVKSAVIIGISSFITTRATSQQHSSIIVIVFDAVTVVVNLANNWLKNISVEKLNKIWGPESKANITN